MEYRISNYNTELVKAEDTELAWTHRTGDVECRKTSQHEEYEQHE